MDFVSLVADIIPIKGGQCSFYFELPINRGFTHKKGVSIRHYLKKQGVLNYDKVQYRGIDPLEDVWKRIWTDIKKYFRQKKYTELSKYIDKDIYDYIIKNELYEA